MRLMKPLPGGRASDLITSFQQTAFCGVDRRRGLVGESRGESVRLAGLFGAWLRALILPHDLD